MLNKTIEDTPGGHGISMLGSGVLFLLFWPPPDVARLHLLTPAVSPNTSWNLISRKHPDILYWKSAANSHFHIPKLQLRLLSQRCSDVMMPTSASVREVDSTIICEGTVVKKKQGEACSLGKTREAESSAVSLGEWRYSSPGMQRPAGGVRYTGGIRGRAAVPRSSIPQSPGRPLRCLHFNSCCQSIAGRHRSCR